MSKFPSFEPNLVDLYRKGRAERLDRLLKRQPATAECGNARGAPDCEKCGAFADPAPAPDRRIQIGPTDI